MKLEFLEPQQPLLGGGWRRRVRRGEAEYSIQITPGKRVRIPYKPRGKNIGYHWAARVSRIKGKPSERLAEIWYASDVGKSAGCAGLLEKALYHEFMEAAFGRNYAYPAYHCEYTDRDRYNKVSEGYRAAEQAGNTCALSQGVL